MDEDRLEEINKGKQMKQDVYEKFADKALTYINSTEAFLKEQLPDYFQQVVTYYAIQSWLLTVLGVTLLVAGALCIRAMINETRKNDTDDGVFIGSMVGSIFFIAFGIGLTCTHFQTALKATIAPKVFIVDYLRGKE